MFTSFGFVPNLPPQVPSPRIQPSFQDSSRILFDDFVIIYLRIPDGTKSAKTYTNYFQNEDESESIYLASIDIYGCVQIWDVYNLDRMHTYGQGEFILSQAVLN